MSEAVSRSYHHRHLDFAFQPAPNGRRRLVVHSAEVLRGVLGGDLTATGYKCIGSADLPEAVAQALETVLRDLRTDLSTDGCDPVPHQSRREHRQQVARRLEAFFTRHSGNPLVANGIVVDPRSPRGRQLVAQIRAGQAEPRLLADWVRLRIEWRQIIDAF